MARILLSAYACEPGRGSEPGVGWNWATELAQIGHQVTVITRTDNCAAIEQAPESRLTNLCFLYYDLPRWTQPMRRLPGSKLLYYVLWQWFAARYLRRLFPVPPFDVVQHVTYVSARFPSFMGSLGIPFFFGPVSGGETVPPRLRSTFSLGQRIRERVRDISNRLVALDPLMRHTFRQAQRILVTPDTLPLVPERWRRRCEIGLAIGLSEQELASCKRRPERSAPTLSLLYVGRLLEWKGVDIALRSVARLKRSHPDLILTIVGDGPALPSLVRLTEKLCLDYTIRWTGWLPQADLLKHYQAADILLFPSLRDSGGSVVLEALAHGVPVVCTDLGGPGVIVNDTCGRAVSTRNRGPAQLACEMSETLGEILSTPRMLDLLSAGARARARQFNFQDLALAIHPAPAVRIVSRKA